MFTEKDFERIDTEYFHILKMGGFVITLKSRCTGHCWHIVFASGGVRIPGAENYCIVYHTHTENTPYHLHARKRNLNAIIKMIKKHDVYAKKQLPK